MSKVVVGATQHDSLEMMRPREVSKQTTLSLATIWRMRKRGEFPEPIRLSPGRVGWKKNVIAAFLAEREAR